MFQGNFIRKVNFDEKLLNRSPGNGKGKRDEGTRDEEKGYKKGIIIFVFTRATLGTQLVLLYLLEIYWLGK